MFNDNKLLNFGNDLDLSSMDVSIKISVFQTSLTIDLDASDSSVAL